MAKSYSLGSIMDGSDDGWSALSYMNPIFGSFLQGLLGDLGSLGIVDGTPGELGDG